VGVVITSDKFITGVVDTAEQLLLVTTTPAINFTPVSTITVNKKAPEPEALTPVNNLSPVLLIPVINNQKAKNLSPKI
jgi:hypothetical protein